MKDKLRELAEMVREAYCAGFIAACKWPEPVNQDVDSSAYIKEFNSWSFSVREKHAAILDAEGDGGAVAWQEKVNEIAPRRQQAVETLLELGWQYNTERGWEEPAPTAEPVAQWDEVDVELACRAAAMHADGAVFPDAYGDDEAEATRDFMRAALRAVWGRASVATHPHSPDAADSGQVGDEAFKHVLASLVAATSLLRRVGKTAAPSDKMFQIMLNDYEKAIAAGRAALAAQLEQITDGKAQWDEVANILGADGDNVDDVIAKATALAAQGQGEAVATVANMRAELVAKIGDCCMGGDPLCAGGCLAEKAAKRNAERAATHPAISGVVSDEDVEAACRVNYESDGNSKWDKLLECWKVKHRTAMRAALENFAKGERHER